MRYLIHLKYIGKGYHGWQVQPNQPTIQGIVEEKLSLILSEAISVTGCGRTDAGVNARSYYAHFDTEKQLPEQLVIRMNKMLPASVSVMGVRAIAQNVSARFDATCREYRYFIHFQKDAFIQNRSFWLHSYQFDFQLMNQAAEKLITYQDFSTFEKAHGGNQTSICNVEAAIWSKLDENRWVFSIRANRFLRNMVRRITGAMLSIGNGQMTVEAMENALEKKEPLHVNFAPPAHGLYLWDIEYPNSIFIE